MGGKQWSTDVWRCGSCSLKAFTPTVSVSKYTFLPVFSYLKTATQSQYLLSLCATGSGTFYLQGEPFSWSLKREKECIGSVILRPHDNKLMRRIVTSITRTHPAMRIWQFCLPYQALLHPVLHGVTPSPVLISLHCLWSVSVTGVSPRGHGLSISLSVSMALPSACHTDLLHWTKLSCSKPSPRKLHICVRDAPKAQDVFRIQLWNYLLRHIKRISHINLYPYISRPK